MKQKRNKKKKKNKSERNEAIRIHRTRTKKQNYEENSARMKKPKLTIIIKRKGQEDNDSVI